ncbi:hypothetical protein ACC702_39015, partial [Rhizobium ruizarguesonis]
MAEFDLDQIRSALQRRRKKARRCVTHAGRSVGLRCPGRRLVLVQKCRQAQLKPARRPTPAMAAMP